MINDYSEVTATLNRRVSVLIQFLNDKKWVLAKDLAQDIEKDMNDLVKWIDEGQK